MSQIEVTINPGGVTETFLGVTGPRAPKALPARKAPRARPDPQSPQGDTGPQGPAGEVTSPAGIYTVDGIATFSDATGDIIKESGVKAYASSGSRHLELDRTGTGYGATVRFAEVRLGIASDTTDLAFNISSDGVAWTTALRLDPATGNVIVGKPSGLASALSVRRNTGGVYLSVETGDPSNTCGLTFVTVNRT